MIYLRSRRPLLSGSSAAALPVRIYNNAGSPVLRHKIGGCCAECGNHLIHAVERAVAALYNGGNAFGSGALLYGGIARGVELNRPLT